MVVWISEGVEMLSFFRSFASLWQPNRAGE